MAKDIAELVSFLKPHFTAHLSANLNDLDAVMRLFEAMEEALKTYQPPITPPSD